MKKFILYTTLAFTCFMSFNFRAKAKKNMISTIYFIFDGGNPYDPNNYFQVEWIPEFDCPGINKMCVIAVQSSDLHTWGMYIGLPKVDISTAAIGELSDDISSALSVTADPYTNHGRTIYKKQ